MKAASALLFFLIFSFSLSAQEKEDLLERLSERTEELEDDEWSAELEHLKISPLDINTATLADLRSLQLLNALQISHFISYRSLNGPFIDIHELQAIPLWDLPLIRKLLPYLMVAPEKITVRSVKEMLRKGTNLLIMRAGGQVEKARGYTDSTGYAGGRERVLLKYKFQFKTALRFGFTAEKDPGENYKHGFDFYSFHCCMQLRGIIRAIALGDYAVNLGQGLIQWNGMSTGKSAEVINIKQQSEPLRAYSSNAEQNFLRGAAVSIGKKNITALLFISRVPVSASLETNALTNETEIRTISYSGLHRTASELTGKGSFNLLSFGGKLHYENNGLEIGVNAIQHRSPFSRMIKTEPYHLYDHHAAVLSAYSIDWSYTFRNMHWFGEAALSKGRASLVGSMISAGARADISFLFRCIEPSFQSPAGAAFTESSAINNEAGFYAGIHLRLGHGWELRAYADLFRSPFLKHQVNGAGKGYDMFCQLNYRPDKKGELYLRLRSQSKLKNQTEKQVIPSLAEIRKVNLRLHFSQQLSPAIELRGRTEFCLSSFEDSWGHGYIIYIESVIRYRKGPKLNIRLQSFETTSYEERIYAYEADLPYSSSTPAFFDKGFRYYLLLRQDISSRLEGAFKWSRSVYASKMDIGSGLDEVSGNKRSDLRFQLSFTF